MSLPLFDSQVTFDEFLFIFCLSQNTSDKIEEKYSLCKKVDERLIDFLKLLNKYRKKSEKNGSYNEAKNSRNKIEQIRKRQLERRNKYLKILYETQVTQVENLQKQKLSQFYSSWDQFMNEYQITAADLVKKVKDRQIIEVAQYEAKTRQQLASKMHFSKYYLELQLKEKNLVKLQQYEKAKIIQEQIQEMKNREIREKELADDQVVELRVKALKKQQEASYSTLLQKIQKDRNDHMKKRQSETERLMVRNKSQLTEIDHRYNQTIKKVYEALHNLGLESDKNIKTSRQEK